MQSAPSRADNDLEERVGALRSHAPSEVGDHPAIVTIAQTPDRLRTLTVLTLLLRPATRERGSTRKVGAWRSDDLIAALL